MLVGILGLVLVYHRHEEQRIEQYRQVHEALGSLYEQTLYHSVINPDFDYRAQDPLGLTHHLHRFPTSIDPRWFEGVEPRNVLAGSRPWLDVAPAGDAHDHPPDPILRRPDQAGFWYNPARGTFRARVPAQVTDEATVKLYNDLNNSALVRLTEEKGGSRRPTIPLEMQIATLRRGATASGEARGAESVEPAEALPRARRPALLRASEQGAGPG